MRHRRPAEVARGAVVALWMAIVAGVGLVVGAGLVVVALGRTGGQENPAVWNEPVPAGSSIPVTVKPKVKRSRG